MLWALRDGYNLTQHKVILEQFCHLVCWFAETFSSSQNLFSDLHLIQMHVIGLHRNISVIKKLEFCFFFQVCMTILSG